MAAERGLWGLGWGSLWGGSKKLNTCFSIPRVGLARGLNLNAITALVGGSAFSACMDLEEPQQASYRG